MSFLSNLFRKQPKEASGGSHNAPVKLLKREWPVIEWKILSDMIKQEDADAIPGLIGFVLDGNDRLYLQPAESALSSFGSIATPLLLEALAQPITGHQRGVIAGVLGRIGDRRAVPALLAQLGNKDEFAQRSAVDALGRIKDPRAIPALIQKLDEGKSWVVVADAVEALQSIGAREAIPSLVKLAKQRDLFGNVDTFWGARQDALKALAKLDPQGSIPLFEDALLNDPVGHLRDEAARILKEIGRELPKPEPLVTNIEEKSEDELVSMLKEVARATMGNAPPHLNSYVKRITVAREIGWELEKRGGIALMKDVLDDKIGSIAGQRTIDQFWDDIGGWRG